MPIKNYTTKVPTAQSVAEIIGSIAEHGASAIQRTGELSFTYDNNSGKYSASIATPMTAIAGVYKAERCDCTVKRIAYRECGTSADFTITLLDAAKRGIFNAVAKQFTPN